MPKCANDNCNNYVINRGQLCPFCAVGWVVKFLATIAIIGGLMCLPFVLQGQTQKNPVSSDMIMVYHDGTEECNKVITGEIGVYVLPKRRVRIIVNTMCLEEKIKNRVGKTIVTEHYRLTYTANGVYVFNKESNFAAYVPRDGKVRKLPLSKDKSVIGT